MWTSLGLLAASLPLSLPAYQQGSYFLIDVREDAKAASKTGRIVVAASVFQKKAPKAGTGIAAKAKRSEFETEITSLRTKDSDFGSPGSELIKKKKEGADSESSFGETVPASGGFFFDF
ncbi:hypothetical protein DDZ13_12730 [Coraliomargarita sinensis]|uniref:Uncharacterized protein n=1 Tax=Coraliomargarita sinensis TaxID=2174842 RepID=A0A317ZDD7_9BACT|nr:hypothetical protein DDZ13_12730 [Coraliomargarita sinensis]